MMKNLTARTPLLGAVLAVGALVAACEADSVGPGSDDEVPEGVPVDATRIDWRQVDEATILHSSIEDRRRVVVRTEAEWTAFWAEMHGNVVPMPEPPDVDFEGQFVVAATMGERPTGGYTIEFVDVYADDGTLYPVVRETSPGSECATTQAFTAPATAVVVDDSGLEVEFVEQSRTEACG